MDATHWNSTGRVVALFLSPGRHQPMSPLAEVRARENHGFDGDKHARPNGRRQVLLLDRETLDALNLEPGQLQENITTEGVAVAALQPGQRLRVGNALLEVTLRCDPCGKMNRIRENLKETLQGRRGMLARVLESGRIRPGDAITLLPAG